MLLTALSHTAARLKAYEKLRDLTSDFNDSAKKYAKIIISEVRLPDEAKTIKPVYTIPGLAGGKKFIIHQILFKFAVDTNGMYGRSVSQHAHWEQYTPKSFTKNTTLMTRMLHELPTMT